MYLVFGVIYNFDILKEIKVIMLLKKKILLEDLEEKEKNLIV